MEKPSLDLSSLKTSNYLDFSTDLSEVNAAHDSIIEIQMIIASLKMDKMNMYQFIDMGKKNISQ